jgi:hypothetical protein
MPKLLERIERFCEEERTDQPASSAKAHVMAQFVSEKPLIRCLLALDEGENVVGHLIAVIEVYHGRNILSIWQYSVDERIDRRLLLEEWEKLVAWAKTEWGAKEAHSCAMDDKRARMDSIFWGFKRHRILMRREI